MKQFIDDANAVLNGTARPPIYEMRNIAKRLLAAAEALVENENFSETDAEDVVTGRELASSVMAHANAEHKRIQLEGINATRESWGTDEYGRSGFAPVRSTGRAGAPALPSAPGAGLPARSYASLFGRVPPSGFESAQQFFSIVGQGQYHPALQNAAALGESGVGGALVPTEFEARMIDGALHQSIVLPRAWIEVMNSRTKIVGTLDGQNQSNVLGMYGLTYSWLTENAEVTPGAALARAIELAARPLGCYVHRIGICICRVT